MHIIITSELNIFHFESDSEMKVWKVVTDTVMGGISDGRFLSDQPSVACFRGHVCLENYGGFVMAHTKQLNFTLGVQKGILLRVKGDGKTYSFRIKTKNSSHGTAYRLDFATKVSEWTEVKLSFDDFQATYRGKLLVNEPTLQAHQITELGLMIANAQEGDFKILIDSIKAYR